MAAGKFIQTNFTGGEWTPLLEGRVDLAKYQNSLHRLENMVIDPRGPVRFRPGFKWVAAAKHKDKAAIVVPFIFSKTVAYILEFGDQYIRVYKDDAQIQETYAAWVTATHYTQGKLVTNGGNYYRCLEDHTAGVFATDLAAGKWVATSGATDLAYEIVSPYLEADLPDIWVKCQSADVLYLFHSDYAPMKLSRLGDSSWFLREINWSCPPTKEIGHEPDTTLTLDAVTGSSINFTAGASAFGTSDVGRQIISGVGKAIITAYTSATVVICEIVDDFSTVGPIASGDWHIKGSPIIAISSSSTAKGSVTTVSGGGSTETYTGVPTGQDPTNNWIASGSGVNEYYYAPALLSAKPDTVLFNDVEMVEGTLGSLGIKQWSWGDNDAIGSDKLYVRLADGSDPDLVGSPIIKAGYTSATTGIFRTNDVGKYVIIFSSDTSSQNGVIRIDTYNTPNSVSGEIIREVPSTASTSNWTLEEKVWSDDNGYPSCATLFGQRLYVGGSTSYPETVWGSEVGDYENFAPGTDDSNPVEFSLASPQINIIRWLEPQNYLMTGTMGGEWKLASNDVTQSPITPTNIDASEQTPYGSSDVPPLRTGNGILFVQRAGRKIRELTYNWASDGYVAPDLTVMAEHVTYGGLAGMVYQQEPYGIVWGWTSNGELIGMTYMRDEDVVGWHRHPIDGEIESLAVIPKDGYDQLWAVVKRTINSETVRNIEVMEPYFEDDEDTYETNKGLNAFFVDCGITYTGAATTTITGLDHLEGETVVALVEGSYVGPRVVASGQITLPVAATIAHVGLPITGLIETMRLDTSMKDGTAQGRPKSIGEVTFRVHRSGPFKAGRDENNLDECFDKERILTFGAPYPLFTGDIKNVIDGGWNTEGRITLVQDKPMPFTLMAIMTDAEIT